MSSLSHHGIKGQRWGIRRFQNKDGTLTREGQIRFAKRNLKRAKVRNLDKWGKSPDSNVLYIIGTSGSGKSTTAKGLADDGDQVIHLDTIFEKENHGSPDSNKDFEAFLKENNVDISKASDFSIPREERWQTYDAIGDLVETYGQHCFSKGSKVVIEGVQMGDQTLYPDKNYFNGKPTVVLKGNIVRDTLRADRRDGVPLVKTVGRLTDKERWNWYKQVNATSNEIKYTSIGGTMYIEGNALILGDSSYLEHHGIRGQRWGVRRFQNEDGTLTSAGKKRYSVEAVDVNSSRKEIKKLVGDFSKRDKDFFFGEKHSYGYGDYDHNGDKVAKRFVIKEGKNIVAFIDAERGDHHSNDALNIVVGTAQSARGKGYASILSKTMVDWYEAEGYKNASMLEWNANKDNIGSRKAAEKAGFKEVLGDNDIGYRYSKNAKKELDELSKARMKTKAIEKEVSDKINSDFKKTKLSKISPNTTITPYGEGETGWNSELGFYKSMVVDHYATKWAKKNHAEDIAKYTKASSDWSSAYSKFDKKRRKAQHTSIGGTMYIEGNALILGGSSYLEHHGVLGQKWGVRRYQNKDGTRTAAGKARDQKNAAKTVKNARLFRASANAFQGTKFGAGANKRALKEEKAYGDMAFEILNNGKHKAEYDDLSRDIDAVASFEYEEYSKKRDAMIEINARISLEGSGIKNPSDEQVAEEWTYWADFDEDWGADLKCNSYDRYLVSKGYNPNEIHKRYKDDYAKLRDLASKDAEEYLGPYGDTKITYKDKYTKEIVKTTAKEELANKIVDEATMWMDDYGAAQRADLVYTDKELSEMRAEDAKYSPLKHSALFIEDGTLYLSHHGIRGQRWGIRRFQNRDGSLTNAGRKRLGYATKSAVQTVGKAFKAGVKVGGNAVKAAKAHHEEAEAKKKEKKKEKASQSRLGVLANKDLFTDDELRALNQRFKVEDELKMASIQKGVEIAKAVGTIASNAATAAKAYEDITGQSLSPIKRQAAELKKQQDAEDRARKIASEDAEEARKAAQEERNIKKFDQELRKATADADKEEFLAKKTKAQADQEILKALKGARDFDKPDDDDDDPPKPPSDSDDGSSWMEKATSGGKNVFEQMKYDSDPEYRAAKDAHDEKVARKERMDELDRREKERQAEKEAKDQALRDMINQSNARTGRGQSTPPKESQLETPRQDSDALFSQKGSLPIDKDRYRNRHAAEKAKKVKEDVAEDRAKKQDEKAAKATIDDMMEARRQFTDSARANSNGAFDRETAANYIKGKAKELPSKLNPINAIAKKITNKALKEEEDNARKAMEDEYKKASRSQGRDEANYTMYYNRVNALQAQGYSERQAKKVADTENPFSSKRNRRFEYNEKVGEIETTHRKNSKEINKANKELTDYYYKLVNGPGYEPGSPKREALDRKYAQKRGELEKLEKDNNEMLDREKKKAKKILEHSLSIQNGVLFIDSSYGLSHHGVKGQRWGVRRFQNPDGSLTEKGRKHYEKALAKEKLKQSDMGEGMYHVENGTLFINAGEPYLEHHGVLGMKWGKHLRAGKGPASAPASAGGGGGGAPEEDEETKKKIEEAAKKAGMSVDEYRKKFADKVAEIKKAAYNAAAKAKKEIGYAYGSEYKKDFEKAARLHENNSKSMHAQAKAAWEGYGESRTAAQRDNWKRYAEYDRQAKASGNMFVKRERSKQAYDNSLASKVDSVKRKARLTQDKAKSKISDAVDAAKKTRDDVKGNIRSKTGIGVKKDIERNARLAEGQDRRAHELTKQVYAAKNKDDWARAYSESNKESFKARDNEHKANKDAKSYPKSIAGRVDSAKRKARLTKDSLKSALGKSKQRKQLTTEGPKAKKMVATAGRKVNGNLPQSVLNPKHTDTSHRKKSVGEVMNNAKNPTPGNTPIQSPTQYARANRPRGREKYYKLGQESKGVKKRSRRVKHFDGSDELYTEGTRLVVNSKWG